MKPSDVRPLHYSLQLEADLDRPDFAGVTKIELEAATGVQSVSLNALELDIRSCAVLHGESRTPCTFVVNEDQEEVVVTLPGPESGRFVLMIDYQGKIQEGMTGFYRSRYEDGERGPASLLVTQFQESDARRAFPCFDHPAMKARFQVELTVDESLVALSNGPVIEEQALGDGRKRVLFQETPKMSTYLLFFGVGAFEFLEDRGGRTLVRAAGTSGMMDYLGPGLDFGKKSLEFCEEYYDVPYPMAKLDLIAVSDFAFGAMENWGAMTFRENLLLVYPGVTSRAGLQRIYEVIAHETAHQWFGNLVTPSDWKYLWLNESFATYFGFGVVHHYYPEMGVWEQFLHTEKHHAMERDALHQTFAIEIPGGEHVVINEVTAPIIYSKGANVLRQIEGYIGPESFRQGLRRYLKKFAFSCASSNDLWEALEEASEMPVTRLMKSWLEQPGYPVLHVKREGSELVLRQKRFTFLKSEAAQAWLVPVTVTFFLADGSSRDETVLLEGPEIRLELGDGVRACKVNKAVTGFYRVNYDDRSDLFALEPWIRSGALEVEDRWGLQDDLYAMVQAGSASTDQYLELLDAYGDETAYLPVAGIAANLAHACLVLRGEPRDRTEQKARDFLGRVLSSVGLVPDPAEDHNTSALRDQIIFQAALCGWQEALDFLMDSFGVLRGGGTVHADVARAAMQAGAAFGEPAALDWFKMRFQESQSEHDRMNVLGALGWFQERALMEASLGFVLESVPARNTFVPLVRAAGNPSARAFLWDWFCRHIENMESLHPVHFERIIGALVPSAGLDREEEVTAFFEAYMARKDLAKETIVMALERLEVNRRMRAR